MDKEEIKSIVIDAIQQINEEFDQSLDIDSQLVGEIDSIILVHFLINIEESLNQLGYNVIIANDKAFSQVNSPFKSIKTLIDYLEIIVNE